MLGCSLTDPSDASDFLVLVSSYNGKAQCHLLEFHRNMSSYNNFGGHRTSLWLNLRNPACLIDDKQITKQRYKQALCKTTYHYETCCKMLALFKGKQKHLINCMQQAGHCLLLPNLVLSVHHCLTLLWALWDSIKALLPCTCACPASTLNPANNQTHS